MIETFDQICRSQGLRSVFPLRINALEVVDAGADFVGINFYPKSKRFIGDGLQEVSDALAGKALRVGVFVNEELEVVRGLVI